jgi:hypothetical protein
MSACSAACCDCSAACCAVSGRTVLPDCSAACCVVSGYVENIDFELMADVEENSKVRRHRIERRNGKKRHSISFAV